MIRVRAAGLALAVCLVAAGCDGSPEPADRTALFNLRSRGLALLEEERPEQAATEFARLARLAPDDPLGPANEAVARLRSGDPAAAAVLAREAVERAGRDPDVRLVAARVALELGDTESASAHLSVALEADPGHAAAAWALFEARGEPAVLERLLAESPGNLPARLAVTEAWLEAGDPAAAVPHLEMLERLVPAGESEARTSLRSAVRSARAGEAPASLSEVRRLQNLLRVDPLYAEGLRVLVGRAGDLAMPLTRFRTIDDRGAATPGDAAILLEPAGRFEGALQQAIATDLDGDGDQDLVGGTETGIACLVNEAGEFRLSSPCGPERSATYPVQAADFDGDARPDLLLAGPSGISILRATGGGYEPWGTFDDPDRPTPTAAAADFDHDGDLDVLAGAAGQARFFRQTEPGRFVEAGDESGFAGMSNLSAATFGDVDLDGDLDLVVSDDLGIRVFRNRRQGRFAAGPSIAPDRVASLRLADVDHDGWLDVVAPGPSGPVAMRNDGAGGYASSASGEDGGVPVERTLLTLVDLDGDGVLDAIQSSPDPLSGRSGFAVFAGSADGGYRPAPTPDVSTPVSWLAVLDLEGDGDPDVVVGTPAEAATMPLRNATSPQGHFFEVKLLALAAGSGKVNRLGIGSRLDVWTGDLRQTRTVTGEIERFGLGAAAAPDVVRIEWTNGVPQNVIAPEPGERLVETQVLKGSCGFLYAWTGERFEFVTDIMWKSALGMPLGIMAGEMFYAPPQASLEYVRLPPGVLKERDGFFDVRITEELWEVGYLDELVLVAIDHPAGVEVYVDEAFDTPRVPNEQLYFVERRLPIDAAVDHEGNPADERLAERDFVFVGGFTPGPFQGTTELHDLTLTLAAAADTPSRLFLSGWLFPTDASLNVQIGQAGSSVVVPPYLEVPDGAGGWRRSEAELAFPTGKNKTVVVELPRGVPAEDPRVRIRTTMEIYWDEAFYAPAAEPPTFTRHDLPVDRAEIRGRGFSRPFRRGGRYGPHWFDYSVVTEASPWRPLPGAYTRFGDVTELLEAPDDRYVVFGPGDEIAVRFRAPAAPGPGLERTLFLYSDAFLKDADLNTLGGDAVGPLPHHGQGTYPPPRLDGADRRRFVDEYLTRRVPAGMPAARPEAPTPRHSR